MGGVDISVIASVLLEADSEKVTALGTIIAALSACYGVIVVQYRMAKLESERQWNDWLNQIRIVYIQFWKTEGFNDIRRIIENDNHYNSIKTIIENNMKVNPDILSRNDKIIIDNLDNLLATMAQVNLLGSINLSKRQKRVWNELFGSYWMGKILSKPEIRIYIEKYWPRLLETHNRSTIRFYRAKKTLKNLMSFLGLKTKMDQ